MGDATWEAFPEPVKDMFAAPGPAILTEMRGGFLDLSAERLATIRHPVLLVAAKCSPPAFAEVTTLRAESTPTARIEWIEGGHLIDPANDAVLSFLDEVLARA